MIEAARNDIRRRKDPNQARLVLVESTKQLKEVLKKNDVLEVMETIENMLIDKKMKESELLKMQVSAFSATATIMTEIEKKRTANAAEIGSTSIHRFIRPHLNPLSAPCPLRFLIKRKIYYFLKIFLKIKNSAITSFSSDQKL